jgi:5-methyltetrahydropteroyltriglutamate--homocysteine methyltransferase
MAASRQQPHPMKGRALIGGRTREEIVMPATPARKPARKSAAPSRRAPAGGGRILTTHVGSLVRPPALKNFLAAQRDGQLYDETAFQACLHDSVAEVVRKQAEIGLDIVNDGEYGKTISWSRYVLRRLSGFEQRGHSEASMPAAVVGRDRREFADFYADYDRSQGFSGMSG